jgi:hypothetical protein
VERATDKTEVEISFRIVAPIVGSRSIIERMMYMPMSHKLGAAAEIALVVGLILLILATI